ncbi:MAG: Uma2 family endonuclease [Bryobacteraceae bacterium]|jgi:Uma2 family endonuclease
MPAVADQKLSIEEFHARYDGEKPYYEYWNGEAVQKSMPTLLHGLIQGILLRLLSGIGYVSASEVTLNLDPAYEPVPDVIANDGPIGDPYPTSPFDMAIEILSPKDPFSRVLRKCRLYERWGIRRILVIDPVERLVWHFEHGAPQETDILAQRGDAVITAQTFWDEVDLQLARASGKS